MVMDPVRTLLTGRGLVESPRWHGDRLYVSDWSAGEVLSVDLDGRGEVVIRAPGSVVNPAGMSSQRPGRSPGSVPRYWQSWR